MIRTLLSVLLTFFQIPSAMSQTTPDVSKNVLYYGNQQPLPKQTLLTAGPLRMVYENGALRYLKLGDREVLRMIYVALRDENWGTYTPYIEHEKITAKENSFQVSYQCHYQLPSGEKLFTWQCTINGEENGKVTFTMDGKALTEFKKNRLGFCVLHPIEECAGKTCQLTHTDGKKSAIKFPVSISPHQPATHIQAMNWEPVAGCQATVRFMGDAFEMEDQRNWSDASYKTYCTPQDGRPAPVTLREGDKVSQSVTISLSGNVPEINSFNATPLTFAVQKGNPVKLPSIGLGQSTTITELSPATIGQIKSLGIGHYRTEINLFRDDWQNTWQRAVKESRQIGCPLEVALHVGEQPAEQLAAFVQAAQQYPATIQSIAIFRQGASATSAELIKTVLPELRKHFSNTKVGGGTLSNFTELNRQRTPTNGLDFLTYAVNPQIHAFDNGTMTENNATQPYVVASVKQFSDVPVHLSPVTLKSRPSPAAKPVAGQIPPGVDARQPSLFGAAWTLGNLKYVAEANVASVTYFETAGLRGVVQGESPAAFPEFTAPSGSVFPVYFVMQSVLSLPNAQVLPGSSSEPLQVEGLALTNGNQQRIILANQTPQEREIRVEATVQQGTLKTLDETNATEFMQNPSTFLQQPAAPVAATQGYFAIRLKPYGIAVLETKE